MFLRFFVESRFRSFPILFPETKHEKTTLFLRFVSGRFHVFPKISFPFVSDFVSDVSHRENSQLKRNHVVTTPLSFPSFYVRKQQKKRVRFRHIHRKRETRTKNQSTACSSARTLRDVLRALRTSFVSGFQCVICLKKSDAFFERSACIAQTPRRV